MPQQQLQFTDKTSIREAVLSILQDGNWWASFEIQAELDRRGLHAGEQTVTAKIRDARKARWGSHSIECKAHAGIFKYRLVN